MITKLDCNVMTCAYNTNNCCRRSGIEVEGEGATISAETCCGSFMQKGKEDSVINACGTVKKDTEVHCDALDCIYNKSRMCHANHIGIIGRNADSTATTECASFVMR